jgi:hypothetical protein
MPRYWIIMLMGILLLAGCSTQTSTPTNTSIYNLDTLYYYLQAVSDMETSGVLSPADAASQRAFYLQEAQVINGEPLTEAQLADHLFSNEEQSWLRFLNFVNLIWAFASVIIVLSSVWIFAKYIFPILKQIPIIVYEILLYAACAGFIFGGLYADTGIRQFVALPGVLGLFFLLPFSYGRHIVKQPFNTTEPVAEDIVNTQLSIAQDAATTQRESRAQLSAERVRRDFMLENLVLTVIWGAIAIAYESVMIGFLTILVLMGAMALSPFVPRFVERMGFKRYDLGATVLVISFVLVMIFFATEVLNFHGIYAEVFKPAVFWIGTEAYFTALTVLAVRWYHREKPGRYLRWQIVSIVSGIVALYIGTYWNIPVIQEIAGTYFLIYLFEKYIEMQDWRRRWAWASLGLGIMLYIAALLINIYPQFFLLG